MQIYNKTMYIQNQQIHKSWQFLHILIFGFHELFQAWNKNDQPTNMPPGGSVKTIPFGPQA